MGEADTDTTPTCTTTRLNAMLQRSTMAVGTQRRPRLRVVREGRLPGGEDQSAGPWRKIGQWPGTVSMSVMAASKVQRVAGSLRRERSLPPRALWMAWWRWPGQLSRIPTGKVTFQACKEQQIPRRRPSSQVSASVHG